MLGTLFWIISNHKRVSRAKGRGFWSSMNVTVVIQTWTLLRKVCNTMQDLCRCCKFKLWFWIDSVNSNFIILNKNVLFYVHVTVHRNKFLFNKTNRGTNFSEFIFVNKFYMFRAFPLPIIKSFKLYIRHWYMSSNLHDIYQCRMYSGKLLMMGRGTARNM